MDKIEITRSSKKEMHLVPKVSELPSIIEDLFDSMEEYPENVDAEGGIRLLLTFVPTIGGALDRILFGNKDKKEIEKIKFLLFHLGLAFKKVDDSKLDKEYLESDEYYALFKRILEKIKFEHRQEKIIGYRNFLVNCSILDSRIGIDTNYLLSKLDSVDKEHLEILNFYYDNKFDSVNTVGSDYDNIKKQLKNISKFFHVYETDLVNAGFLIQTTSPGGPYFRYYLSDLGKEFLRFIKYD